MFLKLLLGYLIFGLITFIPAVYSEDVEWGNRTTIPILLVLVLMWPVIWLLAAGCVIRDMMRKRYFHK